MAFSVRLRQSEQRPKNASRAIKSYTHASQLHHLTSGFSTGLNYSHGSSSLVCVQRRGWGLDLSLRACPTLIHKHILGGKDRCGYPSIRLAGVQGSTTNSGSPDGPQRLSPHSPPSAQLRLALSDTPWVWGRGRRWRDGCSGPSLV